MKILKPLTNIHMILVCFRGNIVYTRDLTLSAHRTLSPPNEEVCQTVKEMTSHENKSIVSCSRMHVFCKKITLSLKQVSQYS